MVYNFSVTWSVSEFWLMCEEGGIRYFGMVLGSVEDHAAHFKTQKWLCCCMSLSVLHFEVRNMKKNSKQRTRARTELVDRIVNFLRNRVHQLESRSPSICYLQKVLKPKLLSRDAPLEESQTGDVERWTKCSLLILSQSTANTALRWNSSRFRFLSNRMVALKRVSSLTDHAMAWGRGIDGGERKYSSTRSYDHKFINCRRRL